MRIGVVGAGAVGGAIAAVLARGGHQVFVTARGVNLAAIREHGIRLSGAWGDYVASVDAAEMLEWGPELAIVATKAGDAVAAIRENSRVLRGIPVMIVQNGLEAISAAKSSLPRSDVVGALALFASSLSAPGEVLVTAGGHSYLGVAEGEDDIPARFVARVLGEVMPVSVVADFEGAQWTKLLINHVNALPAITGLSAQETIADRSLRRVLTASMRETLRVGRKAGVRFAPIQSLTKSRLRWFARLPLWAGQIFPMLMARRMGATPNPGSTLQSIRRGLPTEIDFLNGAVVAVAKGLGGAAPINAELVELVHAVESGNGFFAPGEVVARVRAARAR